MKIEFEMTIWTDVEKKFLIEKKQLGLILESFYDLTEKEQIGTSVQVALSIGSISKFVNLSQNLLNSNFNSVITTETDLNETEFANLTVSLNSDLDSDSEFWIITVLTFNCI